jgi:hypothetical protein
VLGPGSLFAKDADFGVCSVEAQSITQDSYKSISAELTKISALGMQRGDLDAAYICSQKLFEVLERPELGSWEEKLTATLLVIDVLKRRGETSKVAGYFMLTKEIFPKKSEDFEAELVMFSSSLADYFYIMKSPKAYRAYSGLISLGDCNSLARSGYAVYSKRRSISRDWSLTGEYNDFRKFKCPNIEFFFDLMEELG